MLVEHRALQCPFPCDSPKLGIFPDAGEAFAAGFPAVWFGPVKSPTLRRKGPHPRSRTPQGLPSPEGASCRGDGTGLTCIGRLLAMVKLGMGGSALYVFVSAVSVLPNMEPDVKEETIIE